MKTLTVSLIHDRVHATSFNDPYDGSLYHKELTRNWSSDSRKALYWTDTNVYYYDVDRHQSVKTAIIVPQPFYDFKIRWSPDAEHLFSVIKAAH
jgi:hypothetical protein